MAIRKKKLKIVKNRSSFSKITSFTTKSFSNALSNYKKNKELEKIKAIKLKKLEDKNTILKEKKDLKIWEERLAKESNKIKLNEDELRVKGKELKLKDEKLIIENERLIKKDEDLNQISKDVYKFT